MQDCAAEARPLFKAKSEAGFKTAGGALGKIAMQELLGNPAAEADNRFPAGVRADMRPRAVEVDNHNPAAAPADSQPIQRLTASRKQASPGFPRC